MMFFSDKHIWVEKNNDTAKIGISNYAQNELGVIMFLNLPDLGDKLSLGEELGDIESLKTVSDLVSPIGGIVTAINEPLIDKPDAINADPYGSWLIEVSVSEISENLMDKNEYKEFLANL